MRKPPAHPYVLYLAVIPVYRQDCIDVLKDILGEEVQLFTGSKNIDASVTTGIDSAQYSPNRNHFILRRKLLIQTRNIGPALRAGTTIVDLNPRNLTVWFIALARTVLGRRTLMWGHLHPRNGADSRTGWLRRLLRKAGQGTVLYSYDEFNSAKQDLPSQSVWIAPNALYRAAKLGAGQRPQTPRTSVLYVGRLVGTKKVDLLIRAYAASELWREGVKLEIVGSGVSRRSLEEEAAALGCDKHVRFLGKITDPDELRSYYARAICSVSPGYAGLSLTQSLGFGVPMIVADNEPHAPEIELARFDGVTFFSADEPVSLSKSLHLALINDRELKSGDISAPIATYYSADSMARGLADALMGVSPMREDNAWSN